MLQAEPLTSMMQHSHFALSPDWDDAVAWLAARVLRRVPRRCRPRARTYAPESGAATAEATDDAGEMMGPVDYQAHD